jgi:hypothetical protein
MKHFRQLWIIYISFIAIAASVCSCNQLKFSTPDISTQGLRVIADSHIAYPFKIVTANNVLLSSYATLEGGSTLLKTTLAGGYIWDVHFKGVQIKDMVINDDGTYALLGTNLGFPNIPYIFFYNYSDAGVMLKNDSFLFTQFLSQKEEYWSEVKMIKGADNNYIFWGNYRNSKDKAIPSKTVIVKISSKGQIIWSKGYNPTSDSYQLSSCQTEASGGYALLGSVNPVTLTSGGNSKFFILKITEQGIISKEYIYPTGTSNGRWFNPFSASTSDIIIDQTGTYYCFVNPNIEQSAKLSSFIYKIDNAGKLIDTLELNYQKENTIQAALLSKPDQIMVISNRSPTQSTSNIFIQQNAYYTYIKTSTLSDSTHGDFQRYYTDYFSSLCLLSDGRVAMLGMIQSLGSNYYNPVILIRE